MQFTTKRKFWLEKAKPWAPRLSLSSLTGLAAGCVDDDDDDGPEEAPPSPEPMDEPQPTPTPTPLPPPPPPPPPQPTQPTEPALIQVFEVSDPATALSNSREQVYIYLRVLRQVSGLDIGDFTVTASDQDNFPFAIELKPTLSGLTGTNAAQDDVLTLTIEAEDTERRFDDHQIYLTYSESSEFFISGGGMRAPFEFRFTADNITPELTTMTLNNVRPGVPNQVLAFFEFNDDLDPDSLETSDFFVSSDQITLSRIAVGSDNFFLYADTNNVVLESVTLFYASDAHFTDEAGNPFLLTPSGVIGTFDIERTPPEITSIEANGIDYDLSGTRNDLALVTVSFSEPVRLASGMVLDNNSVIIQRMGTRLLPSMLELDDEEGLWLQMTVDLGTSAFPNGTELTLSLTDGVLVDRAGNPFESNTTQTFEMIFSAVRELTYSINPNLQTILFTLTFARDTYHIDAGDFVINDGTVEEVSTDPTVLQSTVSVMENGLLVVTAKPNPGLADVAITLSYAPDAAFNDSDLASAGTVHLGRLPAHSVNIDTVPPMLLEVEPLILNTRQESGYLVLVFDDDIRPIGDFVNRRDLRLENFTVTDADGAAVPFLLLEDIVVLDEKVSLSLRIVSEEPIDYQRFTVSFVEGVSVYDTDGSPFVPTASDNNLSISDFSVDLIAPRLEASHVAFLNQLDNPSFNNDTLEITLFFSEVLADDLVLLHDHFLLENLETIPGFEAFVLTTFTFGEARDTISLVYDLGTRAFDASAAVESITLSFASALTDRGGNALEATANRLEDIDIEDRPFSAVSGMLVDDEIIFTLTFGTFLTGASIQESDFRVINGTLRPILNLEDDYEPLDMLHLTVLPDEGLSDETVSLDYGDAAIFYFEAPVSGVQTIIRRGLFPDNGVAIDNAGPSILESSGEGKSFARHNARITITFDDVVVSPITSDDFSLTGNERIDPLTGMRTNDEVVQLEAVFIPGGDKVVIHLTVDPDFIDETLNDIVLHFGSLNFTTLTDDNGNETIFEPAPVTTFSLDTTLPRIGTADIFGINHRDDGPRNDQIIVRVTFLEALAYDEETLLSDFVVSSGDGGPVYEILAAHFSRDDTTVTLTADLGTANFDDSGDETIVVSIAEDAALTDVVGNAFEDEEDDVLDPPLAFSFGVVRSITGTLDTATENVLFTIEFAAPIDEFDYDQDLTVTRGMALGASGQSSSGSGKITVTIQPAASINDELVAIDFSPTAELTDGTSPIAFLGKMPPNGVYVDNRPPERNPLIDLFPERLNRDNASFRFSIGFDEELDPVLSALRANFQLTGDHLSIQTITTESGEEDDEHYLIVEIVLTDSVENQSATLSFSRTPVVFDLQGNEARLPGQEEIHVFHLDNITPTIESVRVRGIDAPAGGTVNDQLVLTLTLSEPLAGDLTIDQFEILSPPVGSDFSVTDVARDPTQAHLIYVTVGLGTSTYDPEAGGQFRLLLSSELEDLWGNRIDGGRSDNISPLISVDFDVVEAVLVRRDEETGAVLFELTFSQMVGGLNSVDFVATHGRVAELSETAVAATETLTVTVVPDDNLDGVLVSLDFHPEAQVHDNRRPPSDGDPIEVGDLPENGLSVDEVAPHVALTNYPQELVGKAERARYVFTLTFSEPLDPASFLRDDFVSQSEEVTLLDIRLNPEAADELLVTVSVEDDAVRHNAEFVFDADPNLTDAAGNRVEAHARIFTLPVDTRSPVVLRETIWAIDRDNSGTDPDLAFIELSFSEPLHETVTLGPGNFVVTEGDVTFSVTDVTTNFDRDQVTLSLDLGSSSFSEDKRDQLSVSLTDLGINRFIDEAGNLFENARRDLGPFDVQFGLVRTVTADFRPGTVLNSGKIFFALSFTEYAEGITPEHFQISGSGHGIDGVSAVFVDQGGVLTVTVTPAARTNDETLSLSFGDEPFLNRAMMPIDAIGRLPEHGIQIDNSPPRLFIAPGATAFEVQTLAEPLNTAMRMVTLSIHFDDALDPDSVDLADFVLSNNSVSDGVGGTMPVVRLTSVEASMTDPSVVLVELTAAGDIESTGPFTLALAAGAQFTDDAGLTSTLATELLALGEVDTKQPELIAASAAISSVNNPSGDGRIANDLAIIYLSFSEAIVSERRSLDRAAVRDYFGLTSAPSPSGISPFIERADLIGNEAFLTLDLGRTNFDDSLDDRLIIEVLEPMAGSQFYVQDLNGNSILPTARFAPPLDVTFGIVTGITGTYDTTEDPSLVLYTVTFTEPVGAVAPDDFAVVGNRGIVTNVTAGTTANVYTIAVEPSANLEEPIVLAFSPTASIENVDPVTPVAFTFLGELPFNAVYVDNRAPVFVSASDITMLTGSQRRAVLTLEFDEPIDPLSVEKEDDFVFSHDGLVEVLQASSVGNEVRVTLEAVEGGGEETVTFSFTAAAAFQDRYGNSTAVFAPSDRDLDTFQVDVTPPDFDTVLVKGLDSTDGTNNDQALFIVTFTEAFAPGTVLQARHFSLENRGSLTLTDWTQDPGAPSGTLTLDLRTPRFDATDDEELVLILSTQLADGNGNSVQTDTRSMPLNIAAFREGSLEVRLGETEDLITISLTASHSLSNLGAADFEIADVSGLVLSTTTRDPGDVLTLTGTLAAEAFADETLSIDFDVGAILHDGDGALILPGAIPALEALIDNTPPRLEAFSGATFINRLNRQAAVVTLTFDDELDASSAQVSDFSLRRSGGVRSDVTGVSVDPVALNLLYVTFETDDGLDLRTEVLFFQNNAVLQDSASNRQRYDSSTPAILTLTIDTVAPEIETWQIYAFEGGTGMNDTARLVITLSELLDTDLEPEPDHIRFGAAPGIVLDSVARSDTETQSVLTLVLDLGTETFDLTDSGSISVQLLPALVDVAGNPIFLGRDRIDSISLALFETPMPATDVRFVPLSGASPEPIVVFTLTLAVDVAGVAADDFVVQAQSAAGTALPGAVVGSHLEGPTAGTGGASRGTEILYFATLADNLPEIDLTLGLADAPSFFHPDDVAPPDPDPLLGSPLQLVYSTDTTRPRLTGVSLLQVIDQPNDDDQDDQAILQATFTEELDSTSYTAAAVRVTDNGRTPLAGYTVTGLSVTGLANEILQLTLDLGSPNVGTAQEIHVAFPETLRDVFGNRLDDRDIRGGLVLSEALTLEAAEAVVTAHTLASTRDELTFTVTFETDVEDVDVADFSLRRTSGGLTDRPEGVALRLEGAVGRVGMGQPVRVIAPLDGFSGEFNLELLFAPDASFARARPGGTLLTLLHGALGGDEDARIATLDLSPPSVTARPAIPAGTVLGENTKTLVLPIVFNEDIDPVSVTGDDFVLTDRDPVNPAAMLEVSVMEASVFVTLTSVDGLQDNDISISFASDAVITDLVGNAALGTSGLLGSFAVDRKDPVLDPVVAGIPAELRPGETFTATLQFDEEMDLGSVLGAMFAITPVDAALVATVDGQSRSADGTQVLVTVTIESTGDLVPGAMLNYDTTGGMFLTDAHGNQILTGRGLGGSFDVVLFSFTPGGVKLVGDLSAGGGGGSPMDGGNGGAQSVMPVMLDMIHDADLMGTDFSDIIFGDGSSGGGGEGGVTPGTAGMVEDGSDALWGRAGDDILFADGYQGYDGTTTEPGQGGYGGGGTGGTPGNDGDDGNLDLAALMMRPAGGTGDPATATAGADGTVESFSQPDYFATAAAYSTVIEALDFDGTDDDPRLWGAMKQQVGMGDDFHLEGGGGNDIFITGGGRDRIIVDFRDDELADHDIDLVLDFEDGMDSFQVLDDTGAVVRVGPAGRLEVSALDLTMPPAPAIDGIFVVAVTGAMDGFGDGSYVRLVIQLGGAQQTLHLYDFHDDNAATALTAADITGGAAGDFFF